MSEQDPELDRPEESSSADVTLISRGLTVTAYVELSSSGMVVVRPVAQAAAAEVPQIHADDAVELYWVGGQEERTLNGQVVRVETGETPLWHVSVNGPAARSQRRKAVRAQVRVDVVMPWAGAQMMGHTVDLSEGGMRALMDGWGLPPDPGTAAQVSLALDDALIHLPGEIVWTSIPGAQWLLAMRFLEVPEKAGDLLRKRVFQSLRDERAKTAG